MAVVDIPTPRALMVRGDGKIIRHGKNVAVFPDWRNRSKRYSGTLTAEWGSLSESRTYDNNYLTWVEPWESEPGLPSGGIGPWSIPLPPVYALNMKDNPSGFDAIVDLCEAHYGVQFTRDYEVHCAWAYAQGEGESSSEKVWPGKMCCSVLLNEDDGEQLRGMVAGLAFEVSGRNLFGFSGFGVFTSAFHKPSLKDGLDTVKCLGIQLYANGSAVDYPTKTVNVGGDNYTFYAGGVPAYGEVRIIMPSVPYNFNSSGWRIGEYIPSSNQNQEGAVKDNLSLSGSPFVTASF